MNHKVIKNASWIVACRIVQSVLALIISMLTARYLGPSNYGLISYASSIVAFVVPLMQLGLSNILVQETVQNPQEEGAIFGTSMVMSLCSAVACMVGVVAFAFVANANQTHVVAVCALYSIVLIFQAMEMLQYWFQAKLLSKYASIVSLCAYVVVSAYKFILLLTEKSVYWFAVSNAMDAMLICVGLYGMYRKLGGQKLRFSMETARRMFARSKYYIVSSLMVTVFAQTDKIMLTLMINETATGYYSAAIACAGITGFVISAIIDSARPVILEAKKVSQSAYEKSITVLYSVIIYLALAQSLVMTIFARPLITILYGAEYLPASNILQVLVWYTTFSYLGGAKDIWILAEEKQKYLVVLNFAGAVSNVILNLILIPVLGATGAAIASLITQFFTNIVMMFVLKALRRNGVLMGRAVHPKVILYEIRKITQKERE